MRKNLTRGIAFVFVLTLLYSLMAFTVAARASEQLDGYVAYLVPAGNGKVNIQFSVYGNGTLKEIGVTQIQVFKANGTWAATISSENAGNRDMIAYNTHSHEGSVPFWGVSGQSYYAEVTFCGKDSNGNTDYQTMTTSIVEA